MNNNNFTKNDVRDIYSRFKSSGLFYTIQSLERDINFKKNSNAVYSHIVPAMTKTLKLLKEIELRKDLLKERIVRSGPVNGGESWGDFYDYFPKSDDIELKRLFNELQKETDYGFYKEL